MVVDGEGEFNQDDFAFGSSFKTKYEQLVKIKNVGQCVMVLVKIVTTTTRVINSHKHNPTLYFPKELMKGSKHGCLSYTPS